MQYCVSIFITVWVTGILDDEPSEAEGIQNETICVQLGPTGLRHDWAANERWASGRVYGGTATPRAKKIVSFLRHQDKHHSIIPTFS